MKNEKRERTGLNNRGVSLVEIIISITILAVVTLPVLHALVMSARYNGRARLRQQVVTSAESIMESFKAYSLEELYTQFQYNNFKGCTLDATTGSLNVTRIDAAGNDVGVTLGADGQLTKLQVGDTYVYTIENLVNESQKYDARITVGAVAHMQDANVISLKDFNPYRDAIMKSIGATSDFSEDMKNHFKDEDYVDDFLTELNTLDQSSVVFEEANVDYTYLTPVCRTIKVSLQESGGNAVIAYRIQIRYKMKDYPYQSLVADPTSILTLDSAEYTIEVTGETQVYSNPKDMLDRIFFYYYPLYYVDEDRIEVSSNLTDAVELYVIKQKMPSANVATLQTQEASYVGRVSYSGSGAVKLYHNFNENLAGSSSTPPAQIAGMSDVSTMDAVDFMQTQQTLMYQVTVEVYEEGQAALGFTTTPVARLTGTTNE